MKISLIALAVSLFSLSAGAGAADKVRGAELTKACAACHGADFSYPKLAGQHPDYLAHALIAYKRGNGANGRSNPIMAGQVANLSDKDIADIAAYLGDLPSTLHTGKR
ncbi:MAG: cytochrome C [Chloroflexota bacterium]